MFELLSDRLQKVIKRLKGEGKLSEKNIKEGLREVRLALLEADVNFKVVKEFIEGIEKKALGKEVLESLTPGQQLVKIVYDELLALLGGERKPIAFAKGDVTVLMLVGLHGTGKTTTASKLAYYLKKEGKNPLLVSADVVRPAAMEQLRVLAQDHTLPFFMGKKGERPLEICTSSLKEAQALGADVVILDTAGRLHVDEELMDELKKIKEALRPQEVLLVADAMTGQDALKMAETFHQRVGLTGLILTKADGDARGGAALSIKTVIGEPIKFLGTGEGIESLEPFHPDRMASRILGMGDILTLVEKVMESQEEEKAKEWQKRLLKSQFTFEDFLEQMSHIKKLGPLEPLLKMVPGFGKVEGLEGAEDEMKKVEAIILSMTKEERQIPNIINGSRRRRIARGSGTTPQDVNRLLKQYEHMKKMIKKMGKWNKLSPLRGSF